MGDDQCVPIRHHLLHPPFKPATREQGRLGYMPLIPLLWLADVKDDNRGPCGQVFLQLFIGHLGNQLSGGFDQVSSRLRHVHSSPLGSMTSGSPRSLAPPGSSWPQALTYRLSSHMATILHPTPITQGVRPRSSPPLVATNLSPWSPSLARDLRYIDLSPFLAELLGLFAHPLFERLGLFKPFLFGIIPHVLGDPHGTEVRPAHRAEVRNLGALGGQVSSWNSCAVSG